MWVDADTRREVNVCVCTHVCVCGHKCIPQLFHPEDLGADSPIAKNI